jgi:multidrug resistance efflux pump
VLSKLVLPSSAVLGLGFAIFTIASGSRPPLAAQPVAEPARAPFARFIAGAGIVEPSSRSIAIGSPLSRCVSEVLVHVGDEVDAGEPLFLLDDRDLRAELAVRRTALATARAKLGRYQAMPRAEDVPPAEARVSEAEAHLADALNRLALAESVEDPRAISVEEVERRRHESEAAGARLAQARAELTLLEAGAWKADLEVAQAEEAAAEAQVQAIEVELERLVVRAPVAGMILQVNVRAGEFAQAGMLTTPLVLMGTVHPLHVRVDVDENDAWRFRAGAAATASVRGNRDIGTKLRFEYLEPYVVPKRSLTGDTSERVDTRVMQVVFSFERGELPIQVGQQMDVYIEESGNAGVMEGVDQ